MIPILALLLAGDEVAVRITVLDGERPIFARVELRDAAGKLVDSTGYRTLSGHVAPPEGWSVSIAPGVYKIKADAGFEFFAHEEEWTAAAGEKRIALRRWVDLKKEGWIGGGDHNHLNRDGSQDKNYGKTPVTTAFAASLMASRGWSYYQCGGGGPWILPDGTSVHQGRRTEAAAAAWNAKYGAHLHLGWNNEAMKGRYGHLWVLGGGGKGLSYPYTDRPGDAWWSFYDDSWDPWQTANRTQPIGPFKSSVWENPPTADCIRGWRDQGWISIYAHPTRTFTIGRVRVSNLAAAFPFDLLAGAPIGGLAVMGDAPDHADDQALWYAALNEGFQVAGVAENDTVFGSPDVRAGPHTTYTKAAPPGSGFDLGKTVEALAAGRNFMSSGAFCLIDLDGAGPGDTVVDEGRERALSVRAWASSDPADAIESVQLIAGGKVLREVEEAKGKREWSGKVPLRTDAAKWALVKVLGKGRRAVAITNPIYFRRPGEPRVPEPLKAAVSGKVTAGGVGVPAEIVVTAWGKELRRAKAGSDGAYRMEGIPASSHLRFEHAGASAVKVLIFDAPSFRDLLHGIYGLEHLGKPGSFAGGFPQDVFARIRLAASDLRLDVPLPK
jgi:hypothetical protein